MTAIQPSKPKIIATIPCFNTEPFIADVISRARKYVDQVIVIDDGSHDSTAVVAKDSKAIVINHGANKGYGESILSGFKAAKTNGADVIVTLDGDGQHNPDEIPRLLKLILRDGADLVIGSRFIHPPQSTQLAKNGTMPQYRKFGVEIISFLYNFNSATKVSDAQSGFRAYNAEVLDALSLTEKGMGVSVETLIKAREKGFNIKEVPISCLYHSGSSTLNPVIHGLGVAITVVKLRLSNVVRRFIKGQ